MPKQNNSRHAFADPFHLITNPVPVQVITFEPSLEQVAGETVEMLVEKLDEMERELKRANGIIKLAKQDSLRLMWLQDRFDRSHISASDAIFGNHDWTDIRKAIDAAMADGK